MANPAFRPDSEGLFLGVFISTNEPRSPASAIVRMKITRIQLTSKPKCPSPHTSLPMSANKSRHTTLKMTEWWVMAHEGPARDVQNRCPWACGLPAAYFLEYDIRTFGRIGFLRVKRRHGRMGDISPEGVAPRGISPEGVWHRVFGLGGTVVAQYMHMPQHEHDEHVMSMSMSMSMNTA